MKNFILALFIIFSPFQLMLPQVPFINTVNLFLIILLLILLGSSRNSFNVRIEFNLPLFLFLSVWLCSYIYSLLEPNGMWRTAISIEFKRIFTLVLAYFVFANSLKTKKDIILMFGVFIFTIVLVGLHTWRNGTLAGIHFADFKRSSGPFAEGFAGSDIAGGFLATFIPFLIAYAFFAKTAKWQMIGFIGIGISLMGIFATYSRGSMMALAVATLTIILFSLKHLPRVPKLTKTAIILILLIGILGWKIWVPPTIVHRIEGTVEEDIYEQTKLDRSSQKRLAIWSAGIELFKENPIFGAGFKQVQYRLGVDTHNSFILVLAEMGIVGLIIFLWLLFTIFRETLRLVKTEYIGIAIGFIGCLTAFFLVNMFYSNFFRDTVSGSFWIILGILAAAKKVSAQSAEIPLQNKRIKVNKNLAAVSFAILILFTVSMAFAESAGRWWDQNEVKNLNVVKDMKSGKAGWDLYVDGKTGDDKKGKGTVFSPWKTIRKGVANLKPGDTLSIASGVYRERIVIKASGTEESRISIGPEGDGEVIIDCSQKITGWTLHNKNIYKAVCEFKPVAVIVDEKPLFSGFSPDVMKEGRWYYDAKAKLLYLCLEGGDDPSSHNIGVVSDDQYQDGILLNDAHNITLYGLTVRYAGGRGISILGSNNRVEKCNVKFNGGTGINMFNYKDIATDNTQVIKNHIYHNFLRNWPRGRYKWGGWGAGAVSNSTSNTQYAGNVVHKNGGEGLLAYAGKGGTVYRDNIVYDNWSVNIYIDNQPNGLIDRNLIFCHDPDSRDLRNNGDGNPKDGNNYKRLRAEGIMTADEKYNLTPPANLKNITITNNIIIGCRRGITHYGQAEGSGLKNVMVTHNTIVVPDSMGIKEDYVGIKIPHNNGNNKNAVFSNNVIYASNPSTYLLYVEKDDDLNDITFDHNTYYHRSNKRPFRIGQNNLNFGALVNNPKYKSHCLNNIFQEPEFAKGQEYFAVMGRLMKDFKNE